MKLATVLLLSLPLILANPAAQAQNQTTSHVIIVVQENRTPDNLFAADSALITKGADIVNVSNPVLCKGVQGGVMLAPTVLDACFDPGHGHLHGWVPSYDGGAMDGACTDPGTVPNNNCQVVYPSDTYVSNSTNILGPYYQIASAYGFANYFFQTNQGPSFPAHQFLFGGTSAPVPYGDQSGLWTWFAGEEPTLDGNPTSYTGCAAPDGTEVEDINPNDGSESYKYGPPAPYSDFGFPYYNHPTLANLLDNAGVGWSYYAPPAQATETGKTIWVAPNALSAICLPLKNGNCGGTDWVNVIASPRQNGNNYDYAPILTDIANCQLTSGVTWVVPDGSWSDHPGTASGASDGGPSWVAAIVNAIGQNGGGYVGANPPCSNGAASWTNTVVLITWDDWGGWYDHIVPYNCPTGTGKNCAGYPNGTGNWYVYGFRVPLMVVASNGVNGTNGYISGTSAQGGEVMPYIHDVGSILGYIEHVFGLPQGGIGNSQFPYADYFAPDGPKVCTSCSYPLSDFFCSNNCAATFVPITNGVKYLPSCFHTPNTQNCFGTNYQPSDPDDDGIDLQD